MEPADMNVTHNLENREDGLSHCMTCGGAEGSLPTRCPDRKLTAQELDDIYAGKLDYDTGPTTFKPTWWRSE